MNNKPKLKSFPKLSVSLKNSTWDVPNPILPGEYVTCNSDQHRLTDITDKYSGTGTSLGKGAFKDALLIKHTDTGESFVGFDFIYPTSKDSIKEICNFIRIFYKKLEKNSQKCLKNVLCPVDIGVVTKDNVKYVRFVTDYFRGVNLDTWLENHKCKEGNDPIKKNIMIKLIDALDDMHSKWGYTHHDIKPANIMIDASEMDGPAVAIIDIFGGCFDEDCNPMSDEKYKHIIDEVETATNADPDLYAMSKVFKDIVGGRWSGETRGSFECDKTLSDFEQHIYDLSELMAAGKISISEIKESLKRIKI
jgi:serine/threonine protein kinase